MPAEPTEHEKSDTEGEDKDTEDKLAVPTTDEKKSQAEPAEHE